MRINFRKQKAEKIGLNLDLLKIFILPTFKKAQLGVSIKRPQDLKIKGTENTWNSATLKMDSHVMNSCIS